MRQWALARSAGTLLCMVVALELLPRLSAEELRELASKLIVQVAQRDEAIASKDQELQRKDREIKYRRMST